MAMLSISMDLCNSTAIKRDILAMGGGDHAHIARVYEEYYKRVTDFEFHFYSHIYSSSKHIRLEDLFVAKTIGDEVWILYDFPEGVEPDSVGYNLRIIEFIEAATEALLPMRVLPIPAPIDTDTRGRMHIAPPPVEAELDFKIYADLIEHCMESNAVRLGSFNKRFSQFFSLGKATSEERQVAYRELTERLHMGTQGGFAGTVRLAYRTDYIGFEIDRFFRATKFALPGLISLGETLVEHLYRPPLVHPWRSGQEFPIAQGGTLKPATYRCVSTVCPEAQMKGIGSDYRIYHLFDASESRLPSGLRRPSRGYEDSFNETRVLLHSEGHLL